MLIVFDLDDTLIDTSGAVTPFKLRQFLEMLKKQGILKDSLEQAFQEICALNKTTFSSKETIRVTLLKLGALHLFDEALALFTSSLPNHFYLPTTPHAKNVLSVLKRWDHHLAIVTGGNRFFQLEKLEKAGLEAAIFSKIAVPEDSKKKPYYEVLLREFLELPRNCVVVGDRIPMDLAPAHELGCRTIHMRWGRGLVWKTENWIDYSIHELSELLELL